MSFFFHPVISSLLYLLINAIAFSIHLIYFPHFFLKALLPNVILNLHAHFFGLNSYLFSPKDGNSTEYLNICRGRYTCKKKKGILWHIFCTQACLCPCSVDQVIYVYINSFPKDKTRAYLVVTVRFICEYSGIRTESYINKLSFLWFATSYPKLLF